MNKKIYHIACILICLPFVLYAQKAYDHNFPKDLTEYTMLVDHISLLFLYKQLNDRDSAAIETEYEKINYIEQLYLVKEPKFPVYLLPKIDTESMARANPEKYRYVLKHKVTEKEINKESVQVISFYFRDVKKQLDFELLEDRNYNTKATLVLLYGLFRKAYATRNK